MPATIALPRVMVIGGGSATEIANVLGKFGLARPLIVTDAYIRQSGALARITAPLDAAKIGYSVFADTVPDPTTDSVAAGLAALQAGDFDSVIAVGGGSPIDTAKAMAILIKHGGAMRDYKAPFQMDKPGLPIVAVPTTAGTGSEVTRFTVITDLARDEKMLCIGLGYVPVAAIVDYEFTLTKPWRLTADTGIDSLTHAIEAYVSKRQNPFADGLALQAMNQIARHIRAACREPQSRAAREAMMLGATQAGMAFSNSSVCLVHGMSRPIGAFFHVPHGLSNAMLLPTITRFSAPAALPRYGDIARAMGVADDKVGDQEAVARLVEELDALNADLKVPSPKAYGIDAKRYRELIATMAEQALASGSPNNNPRVPSKQEIVELYERVYE
jgi:alcohol dehydrogenase class IV